MEESKKLMAAGAGGPSSLESMAKRWRVEADRFRSFGREDAANVTDSHAAELEQWIASGLQWHQDDRMLDDLAHGEAGNIDVFGMLHAMNRVQLAQVNG